MRIAHIDTERTWRGGQQQVFSLIQGLKKRGHENLCVVWKGSPLAERLKGIQETVVEIRPWGEWDVWAGCALKKLFRNQKPDVIHAHSGHAVALAALGTRGSQIPLIVTRRVDFPLSKNPFSKWKYKQAEKIIVISDKIREVMTESGINDNRITLVPSGVDFERYKSVKKVSKNEMGVPSDACVIGQVAALAPHKDQETFIKAMVHLKEVVPSVHGVLVGEGELRDSLVRLAQESGVSDRIHFLGFQSEALNFLSAFDIFCLSSKTEGLGTALIDAMFLKVPVVATRAGGIPELIEEGVTGFLAEPRNPADLAAVLQRAIQSLGNNEGICRRAYEKARKYDVIHTIEGTERVYKEVIST